MAGGGKKKKIKEGPQWNFQFQTSKFVLLNVKVRKMQKEKLIHETKNDKTDRLLKKWESQSSID